MRTKASDDKPTVFISFNCESVRFVDSLQEKAETNATIVRYEDGVAPWGSFKFFMDTIGEQDFAVLVITDAYLKSRACMYEVNSVMEKDSWKETTMFVVWPGTNVYSTEGRMGYITYWSEQYDQLDSSIVKLPESAIGCLKDELHQIERIRDSIGAFLAAVSDAKNPEIWEAINVICDRISISRKTRFMYHIYDGVSLNMKQAMILHVLNDEDGMTSEEICKRVRLSPSEFRYHIEVLLREGFVQECGKRRVTRNGFSHLMNVYSLAERARKLGA